MNAFEQLNFATYVPLPSHASAGLRAFVQSRRGEREVAKPLSPPSLENRAGDHGRSGGTERNTHYR